MGESCALNVNCISFQQFALRLSGAASPILMGTNALEVLARSAKKLTQNALRGIFPHTPLFSQIPIYPKS